MSTPAPNKIKVSEYLQRLNSYNRDYNFKQIPVLQSKVKALADAAIALEKRVTTLEAASSSSGEDPPDMPPVDPTVPGA